MSDLVDRLAEITAAVTAAVAASDLDRKELVTISNTGVDFLNSRSQAAGAIIVYPFPKITWNAPRTVKSVVWTIGIVAYGAATVAYGRVDELLDVVTQAGIVAWKASDAAATPTDFAVSEDPSAPKIPGYSITITEEHY